MLSFREQFFTADDVIKKIDATRRTLPYSHRYVNVGFIGPNNPEYFSSEMQDICLALGKRLTKERVMFISRPWSCSGRVISQSFGAKQINRELNFLLICDKVNRVKKRFDWWGDSMIVGESLEDCQETLLKVANIYIKMGYDDETTEVANKAFERGASIIPIPRGETTPHDEKFFKKLPLTISQKNILTNKRSSPKDISRTVIQLVKKLKM